MLRIMQRKARDRDYFNWLMAAALWGEKRGLKAGGVFQLGF